MKIMLLPSCVRQSGEGQSQFLTSFLINDTIAVDAGSAGYMEQVCDQARLRHVVLSHTHMDHVASLPILVENIYQGNRECITVHGSADVLACLQRDIFNNRIWPDFIALSTDEAPFLRMSPLEVGKPVQLEGVRFTPIAVDHVVPTMGFLVEEGESAILISSDTGPTEELWKVANATPRLQAVFLEVTFPNALSGLATVSKHLTASTFAAEVAKMRRPVQVIAVHIKAAYRAQVVGELNALGLPNLEIGQPGKIYSF